MLISSPSWTWWVPSKGGRPTKTITPKGLGVSLPLPGTAQTMGAQLMPKLSCEPVRIRMASMDSWTPPGVGGGRLDRHPVQGGLSIDQCCQVDWIVQSHWGTIIPSSGTMRTVSPAPCPTRGRGQQG